MYTNYSFYCAALVPVNRVKARGLRCGIGQRREFQVCNIVETASAMPLW